MDSLPTADIRSNLGTYAVPPCSLPAVAKVMTDAYPVEDYDPRFSGQYIQTTYFDTLSFDLRKARCRKDRYLTLRVRCYSRASGAGGNYQQGVFAVSAKTESAKFRATVTMVTAEDLLTGNDVWARVLPADMQARLLELVPYGPVGPIATVCAHRYAVENDTDRLTLDTEITTDTGKHLPFCVLEFKSTKQDLPPGLLATVPTLRPIKLSKFLWSTEV